jgi:transposase-like protein
MEQKGRKGVMGRTPSFEPSFKIAVARGYLEGHLSFSQLAKKHDLPKADTARYFVRWYRKWLLKQGQPDPYNALPPCNDSYSLEVELKQANMRITALEMLIENAGKELGVDILKKPGTKQPGK